MKGSTDNDWLLLVFIILFLAFMGVFQGDDMDCPDGYWERTGQSADWVCP